jgi:hypothetical protein
LKKLKELKMRWAKQSLTSLLGIFKGIKAGESFLDGECTLQKLHSFGGTASFQHIASGFLQQLCHLRYHYSGLFSQRYTGLNMRNIALINNVALANGNGSTSGSIYTWDAGGCSNLLHYGTALG